MHHAPLRRTGYIRGLTDTRDGHVGQLGQAIAAVLLSTLLMPLTAKAECQPGVNPEGDSDRAYQNRGAYCDGLYREDHTRVARLHLVGLSTTGGIAGWDNLTISCRGPTAASRVHVVSYSPSHRYRLDALLDAGTDELPWNPSIPRAIELAPGDVAAICRSTERFGIWEETVLHPVSITSAASSTSGQGCVEMVLTSSVPLDGLTLEMQQLDESGAGVAYAIERQYREQAIFSGELARICLAPTLPGSLYLLNIRGEGAPADWAPPRGEFFLRLP